MTKSFPKAAATTEAVPQPGAETGDTKVGLPNCSLSTHNSALSTQRSALSTQAEQHAQCRAKS